MDEHPQQHLLESARASLAAQVGSLTTLGWRVDDDITKGLTLTAVKLRKNGKPFVVTHLSLQWRPVVATQLDFSGEAPVMLPIWAAKPWLLMLPNGKSLSFAHAAKALELLLVTATEHAPGSSEAQQRKP